MPGEVIDHYPSLGHWSHRVDPTQGFLRPLGNGNRKGNHFGRQKGAGSAIEKGTTLLTHN